MGTGAFDFDMEAVASLVSCDACAGNKNAAGDVVDERKRLAYRVEELLDEVWATLMTGGVGGYRPQHPKDPVPNLSFRAPEPPSYTAPPPSYDDAINDLPPDYAALPALAQRNTATGLTAPEKFPAKSHRQSSALLKDRTSDVYIDFESPAGVREHKKKKTKKGPAPPPTQNNGGGSDSGGDDQANGVGGDAGGDGGGAGDGNGDDGDGGDDDWGGWTVSGSKKKNKKKKEEEEEEERKAAEASAANNLSWADEVEEGDDSWAGFTTVGKKKKKGKV